MLKNNPFTAPRNANCFFETMYKCIILYNPPWLLVSYRKFKQNIEISEI